MTGVNIEMIRIIPEKISIMLNGTSPVNINSPFARSKPAQNIRNLMFTSSPKINIRKAIADAKSIAPSILTTTIKMLKNWSL